MKNTNKTALITGASRGLGFELANALADQGWNLIINGRNAKKLLAAQQHLAKKTKVEAISGDVIDEIHLLQFPDRLASFNGIDLVVNNASTLGASPLPKLLDFPIERIHTVFHTNVIAPLSLLQKISPFINEEAVIINVSSDAAIHAYEGWGGYGSSKAALDHLTQTLAKENPQWHIYAVDPGDMQTTMHQEAFPGEDISDRPLPEKTVAGFLFLVEKKIESGRYISAELIAKHLAPFT